MPQPLAPTEGQSLSTEASSPLGGPFRWCHCGSSDFSFHLVFFPAAFFLSAEAFGVEVLVGRILAIGPRVVNLLSYPSLACRDWRLAVVAELNVIGNHWFLIPCCESACLNSAGGALNLTADESMLCTRMRG